MCPGSHTPPVTVGPVALVVPAPVGLRASPVAHLVPPEAGCTQDPVGQLVLGGLIVILRGRHLTTPNLSAQLGAFLNDQGVGRDMVRFEVDSGVQARAPVPQRLPRRAVDQVDADRETGSLGGIDRRGHIGRVVGAFQRRQHVGHGRLHAEADPVEPAGSQCPQRLRGDRVRVGFSGHLHIIGQAKPRPYAVQHPHEVAGRHRRGRASPEEHRLDRWGGAAQHLSGQVKLAKGNVGVRNDTGSVNAQLGQGVGVEVAIATPHRAERDMDIDAKRP